MNPLRGTVERYRDATALARAAAEGFVDRARRAVESRGRFSVALTGGGSPRELYALLGAPELSARVPWSGVHLSWGDDRCVPPAHPRSNFGLARDLFIARVPIPAENVHRIRGELPAREAARRYEDELNGFFGGPPTLDLVHLGLGADGHIASLFPFDLPRLTNRSGTVLTSLRLPEGEPRVTLSLAAINAASRIEFLLPSSDNAAAASRAMYGPLDPFALPAQLVAPRTGDLVWLTLR